ncbi:hypothetical protein [Sessilibacter corallicola]|uniref:Sulfotransferase domain-containing protein n=1 Tax=Sessilibacter corallicola TaxID=2904075 RepID=A0ABQ0A834_9GAMM
MKIVLHIGSDKTGTTALQSYFAKNRKALLDNGLLYPKLDKTNHHECLARELLTSKQGTAWQNFHTILSNTQKNKKIIISSEMLCSLSDKYLKLLKIWLKEHQITIIAYIRDTEEYLESGVMQKLKTSKNSVEFKRLYRITTSIPFFINPIVYQAGLKNLFAFRWKRVFDEASIILRPYSKYDWIKENLIEDFFYHLNEKIVCKKNIEATKNITPTIEIVYLCSKLNSEKAPWIKHEFAEVMTQKLHYIKGEPISSPIKRKFAKTLNKIICYLFDIQTFEYQSSKFNYRKFSLQEIDIKADLALLDYISYNRKQHEIIKQRTQPSTNQPTLNTQKHETD